MIHAHTAQNKLPLTCTANAGPVTDVPDSQVPCAKGEGGMQAAEVESFGASTVYVELIFHTLQPPTPLASIINPLCFLGSFVSTFITSVKMSV